MVHGVAFQAVGWLIAALACVGPPARAAFYVGGEAALQGGSALALRSGDNDRPARCDEFVNPRYAELEGCTAANHGVGAVDDWTSAFDAPRGVLASVVFGYQPRDRWRLEIEAGQRVANVDQTVPASSPEDGTPFARIFGAELPAATERIDALRSRHLFANAYWQWPGRGRWTPFVGIGGGVAFASLEHAVLWQRSSDPNLVETARGLPNEAEVRRNLAGTASRARRRLRDRLAGWQLLAGAEYALTPVWSLAVHGRWVRLAAFEDGGSYAELRGHVSNLRLDGSEPVFYRVSTDDAGFAALGLRLRYEF